MDKVDNGVSSYELLTSTNEGDPFDLKTIAHSVSQQFDSTYQAEIEDVLPTIFQVINFCTSRYLNTVFSQILVISGFKGLRRLISQCPVRAYLIVKLNILCFDNDERPSYIFSSRRTGVHLLY